MTKRDIIRYSFVFLTFLGVFSTYPKAVYQARAEEPAGDVIYISTPQEFQDINLDLTAHYEIINDIDFTGFTLSPIATNHEFTGILNGNNFSLSNLQIDLPNPLTCQVYNNGFISGNYSIIVHNNGVIRNLSFYNVFVLENVFSTCNLSWGGMLNYDLSFLVNENLNQGVIENIKFEPGDLSLNVDGVYGVSHGLDESFMIQFSFAYIANLNTGLIRNVLVVNNSVNSIVFANAYRRSIHLRFSLINHSNSSLQNIQHINNSTNFFGLLDHQSDSLSVQKELILSNIVNSLGNSTSEELVIVENIYIRDTSKNYINIKGINDTFSSKFSKISASSFANYIVRCNLINIFISTSAFYEYSLNINTVVEIETFTIAFFEDSILNSFQILDNIKISSIVNNYSNYSFYASLGKIVNSIISESIVAGEKQLKFDGFQTWLYSISSINVTNSFFFGNGNNEMNGLYFFNQIYIFIPTTDLHLVRSIKSRTSFSVIPIQNYLSLTNSLSMFNKLYFGSFSNGSHNFVKNGFDNNNYFFLDNNIYYLKTDNNIKSDLDNNDIYFIQDDLNPNWSKDFLIEEKLPTLIFFLFDFEIKNEGIYNIGTQFSVNENFDVYFDGVKLNTGQHFLNYAGIYRFDFLFLNQKFTSFITVTHSTNIIQDSYYSNYVIPSIYGHTNLTLNNIEFLSGTPITTPGLHTLTIFGENGYEQDITFTIVLETDGVTDESTYTDSVTPTFSGGTATLDGEPFESGTEITDVGNYTLIILGVNGFREEINFKILPVITGLQDGVTEDPGFQPNITGEGMTLRLNGDPYTIGTPITTPGLHTLTIFGENGYEQDITFTIVLETDGVTDESTYTDSVTPTFSGGTATLNGEPFDSGTEITDVGNYTLIILGVNGFREEINFKILPVITGLQDGVTEDPGFQPNITGEGMTLRLNGDPYTIGTPITTPGLHTLTIFGENGYEQDITFTIRLIFNGVSNNQTIVNDDITITFSGGQALLNDDEIQTGFTTNKLGNYRLVIYGLGNEVELDYAFTILPDVQGLNNLIYTGNVQPNISGNSFSMTLNGAPYAGGNITMPGDHALVIYGYTLDNSNQNEVMYTKNFRINVRVQNVANGENYLNQSKTIIVSGGNATLNGQSIGLNHQVTSIGHYSLVISGVNGYIHEVNFTISPDINGVNEGQIYTSSTNIQVLGVDAQVTLNGNPISNGILTYPGQHELVISGVGNFEVRRTFSIVATIDGVEDEEVYINQTNTITFSGGDATLNGVPIQSGYVLDRIGHFELTISGVNGYSLTYNFTNLPDISGVEDEVQYTASTNIQILGNGVELLMNGQPFTNRVYSEPGQHELEIFAAGSYYQLITFSIKPIISGGVLDGQIYINSPVNIVITGGSPTLNGVAIPLNHVVNEVGNYTLIIPQNNLPNVVITFRIDPAFTKLANNRTYNGSITPTIVGTGMTITLNGRPYVSGTTITNPGSNIIRITSQNGEYEKIINFTVNLVFSGLVDGVTYYDLITPSFSGGIVTLNGEPFESNTTITTLGEFELLIIGDNNYSRSYSFTILPYNISFPQDGDSWEEVNLNIYRVHSLTQITLNEEVIRQTRLIKAVGHYDLVMTFDGETISDTRFTVEPQNYIEDGSEFDSPLEIYHPHATVKINGQEVSQKYRIDIQKQYTIEVFGVNDYYHTYTFKFYNPNLQVYQVLIAPMLVTAIGSMAIFFMRKRWIS